MGSDFLFENFGEINFASFCNIIYLSTSLLEIVNFREHLINIKRKYVINERVDSFTIAYLKKGAHFWAWCGVKVGIQLDNSVGKKLGTHPHNEKI